jgi:HTH-type transcriptional regulator/antitoxin HigA
MKALNIDRDYLKLIERFPLRPIRSGVEHGKAVKILSDLIGSGSQTRGERDYTDALVLLIENYERNHVRFAAARMSPLDLLKYLMKEHGMTAADLGRAMGTTRALASMILNGRRDISKANAKALGERFALEPGAFI